MFLLAFIQSLQHLVDVYRFSFDGDGEAQFERLNQAAARTSITGDFSFSDLPVQENAPAIFVLPVLLDDVWDQVKPRRFHDRLHLKCFDQSKTAVKTLADQLKFWDVCFRQSIFIILKTFDVSRKSLKKNSIKGGIDYVAKRN